MGLYAPGGRLRLVSSVIMNVVPAQEAGVESIALASPPQKEFGGLPHPTILAACALLGVDEVYAAGGAQAVAMFAYGTESVRAPPTWSPAPATSGSPPPSGYFTGQIGIDAEAGPTEIAILADATADPVHVAADLISQAEHDPLAAAVLVTDSVELADAVEKELEPQVAATKHIEDRIRPGADRQAVRDRARRRHRRGPRVVDAYGAEHLEIQTADAAAVAARVRNAGAIFVGPWAPVSLGDYCAGLQPRAAHRRLRLPLLGSVRPVLPARHPHRGLHAGRAGRGHAPRGDAGRGGGPARRTARRSRRGSVEGAAAVTGIDDLPVRDELRGSRPTARPSWTCPYS